LHIANQRRQRGNVERYSDLLIQGEGPKPGEVDMVIGAEQADEQQQRTCAQGGDGLRLETVALIRPLGAG